MSQFRASLVVGVSRARHVVATPPLDNKAAGERKSTLCHRRPVGPIPMGVDSGSVLWRTLVRSSAVLNILKVTYEAQEALRHTV